MTKIAITGAHLTPALATIEELKKIKEIELVYIGRKTTREGDNTPSVESKLIPQANVKFIPIITGRLQRSFTRYTIPSLLKVPIGFVQSLYILLREKPDVILSFGGYVAVPVVICAFLLNIPIIIHEQTLVSGLANQICALFADKIAITFPGQYKFNENKLILTGNPIRKEVLAPTDRPSPEIKKIVALSKEEKKPIILVTGGNQGAHSINVSILEVLGELTTKAYVIHQTGQSSLKDYERSVEIREKLKDPSKYYSSEWISSSDFGYLLKNIDVCISRAGANTLLELALYGIPTLVVPLPFVNKDEQNVNAKYFSKIGLSVILSQNELSASSILASVNKMILDLESLKKKAIKAKEVVILNGEKKLAQETLLLSPYKDAI